MWASLRSALYRYVPAHVGNPFALARRMISSRNRAALFTLFSTMLGVLCIPLDLLISLRERRLLASAAAVPARPVIFICGPARSGTTLVFQVLCRHLDVSYLQNVTALFPRSPVTVTKIYRRLFGLRRESSDDYLNYYGKTARMSGPSEANHVWNRWVEPDATGFRTVLPPQGAREAARFFAAFAGVDQKPVVSKNNNMNVFADVISAAMPNALIICLRRSPAFLAQSLIQARRDIHGSESHGYGVRDPGRIADESDTIISVCQQVSFLERKSLEMAASLGSERFWLVDYEDFCREPGKLVAEISKKFGIARLGGEGHAVIAPIATHNVVRDPSALERIQAELKSDDGTD